MRTDKWRYGEWAKPGHTKVIESLSRQLREKFPVQEFKEPGPKPPQAAGRKRPKA